MQLKYILDSSISTMSDQANNQKYFGLTITKQHLNQFFNVIQFLSKIGKEVMIEVDDESVSNASILI